MTSADVFKAPEFLAAMIGKGILGNKTKGGFYRRQPGEGGAKEIWALDHLTLEYRPVQKVKLPALEMAKNIDDLPERIKTLVWGKDRVGAFLWKTMSRTFRYAANRIPEIADTIVEIDRAMRWGFNWELGVFETWDAIGVEKSVARMKEEGQTIPANVQKLLDAGAKSFYKKARWSAVLFRLCYRAIPAACGPAGRDHSQVSQRSHRSDQEKLGRVARRHRRRRGLPGVSLKDECDRRRHPADVEAVACRSGEEFRSAWWSGTRSRTSAWAPTSC